MQLLRKHYEHLVPIYLLHKFRNEPQLSVLRIFTNVLQTFTHLLNLHICKSPNRRRFYPPSQKLVGQFFKLKDSNSKRKKKIIIMKTYL